MELGERIRQRRQELGWTQADVCNGAEEAKITRNMLSLIEKGKATPALDTLLWLSKRLSVPPGYFFCEEDEEFFYRKQNCFPRLRALYRAGSYAECLRVFEKELGSCDDELGLMMACCAYFCGQKAWHNGAMESAVGYLQSALAYAEETVYPTDGIRAGCGLLTAIGVNVQAPLLEFNEMGYIDSLRKAGCLDVYFYLKENESYPYENPFYAMHVRARLQMKEGRYEEALHLLNRIEEQKGADSVSAFLLFRTYSDMESCYREGGDYEAAYRYSSKRMRLLSAFRS